MSDFDRLHIEGNPLDRLETLEQRLDELYALVRSGEDILLPNDAIIRPDQDGQADAGSSSYRFGNIYTEDADVEDDLTVGDDVDVGGDVDVAGSVELDAFLRTVSAGELTISSGAVTVTGTYHSIDTESDAASDDLDTINGGSAGRFLVVSAEDDGRTVVCKHGTGNLLLASGADFSMDHSADTIMLIYDGSNWLEISRASNS